MHVAQCGGTAEDRQSGQVEQVNCGGLMWFSSWTLQRGKPDESVNILPECAVEAFGYREEDLIKFHRFWFHCSLSFGFMALQLFIISRGIKTNDISYLFVSSSNKFKQFFK